MTDRIIVPRAVVGVPDPGTRARLAGPIRHLLVHYTGSPGYSDPTKDLDYAKSVARYGISSGKTFEYNYIVGLGGTIFEQAGDRVGAHCKAFNPQAYGVLLMLGIGVQPTAAMLDSFRWLRSHLIGTGALHPASDAVPHYRYRATACPGTTLADVPHGRWASPTGEGSLGDLHAALLEPWVEPTPAPIEVATPATIPTGDDMFLIKQPDQDAVFLVIPAPRLPAGRCRVHVTAAQYDGLNAAYGPLCTVASVESYGSIVGA